MKSFWTFVRLISTLMIIIGMLLVGFSLVQSPKPAIAQEGDPVRGGLLYEAWWTVLHEDEEEMHMEEGEDHEEGEHHEHDEYAGAPEEDNPLAADSSLSGPDSWNCVECHGWDYKGDNDFTGILDSAGQPVEDIVAVLQGSTNPDHDFSSVMEDQDLLDLATFISGSLIDDDTLLNADNSSAGDAANGEVRYGEVCIKCHGPAGNAINFGDPSEPEFLGHVVLEGPWEIIHKVRFGQVGWPMPSGINNGWSDQDVADVLAYLEGFDTEPALSGGGPLYDNWAEALEVEPEGDQPLWSTQDTNTASGADTWRCKECHGWDYLGAEGAYGSGSHQTGFVGVLDAASMSSEDLLGWLDGSANADHDFSEFMDETALNALVTFLQQETIDITPYVNDDGTVNGDPRHGRDLFGDTCAACHGVDGRTMNFGSEDEPEFVGTIASENPWEFFHKASFGNPGVPMPAGRALGWSEQDIADVLSFAQTLPRD